MKFKILFLLILITSIGLFNFLVFQEIKKLAGLEKAMFGVQFNLQQ